MANPELQSALHRQTPFLVNRSKCTIGVAESVLRKFRALFAVFVALLAAACGGGGGGGAGDGGVSIALVSPSSVDDKSFAGMSPTGVNIQIKVSGNFASLNGKTVYVLAVVPDALYEPNPVYHFDTSTSIFHLSLTGKLTGVAQGRYQNTMRIYACLDVSCNTQLGNSPISIPYVVEMLPSLSVSTDTVNLTTPFGVSLPESPVAVTLPQGANGWDLFAPGFGGFEVVKSAGGDAVLVRPYLVAPGTYTRTAFVQTTATHPSLGTPVILQKSIAINYTITPSSAVYAMHPSSASYAMQLNDPQQQHQHFDLVSQDPGGSFSLRGVSYTSSPAAASGHAWNNRWLYHAGSGNLTQYAVIPCDYLQQAPAGCLPQGTYTGAILYRHTSGSGALTDFEFPVTMTISP